MRDVEIIAHVKQSVHEDLLLCQLALQDNSELSNLQALIFYHISVKPKLRLLETLCEEQNDWEGG